MFNSSEKLPKLDREEGQGRAPLCIPVTGSMAIKNVPRDGGVESAQIIGLLRFRQVTASREVPSTKLYLAN